MKYKLKVGDRNYESWSTYEASSLDIVDISLNPAREKLFDQDIFDYSDKRVIIKHLKAWLKQA